MANWKNNSKFGNFRGTFQDFTQSLMEAGKITPAQVQVLHNIEELKGKMFKVVAHIVEADCVYQGTSTGKMIVSYDQNNFAKWDELFETITGLPAQEWNPIPGNKFTTPMVRVPLGVRMKKGKLEVPSTTGEVELLFIVKKYTMPDQAGFYFELQFIEAMDKVVAMPVEN